MPRNPDRNYAIDWLRGKGLTETQAAAIAAVVIAGTPAADASGAVYGDVVGGLLGPLSVVGIHGNEISPPALAADANDYAPSGSDALIWRLDLATFALTGIAAPETPGEVHILVAVSAGSLNDEDAGSIAENRILTGTGADLALAADAAVVVVYDGTSLRWRVVGGSGGGGVPAGAITTSGLTETSGTLLGRTTAGTGAIEEITPGTGLTLSAGVLSANAAGSGRPSFDITPPLSNAMAPWVKPSGSGLITADAQGRISIDTGAGYKSFPGLCYLEGRLHLVYRSGTDHVATGDGVIKYRYSDNLGRTWSSAATIVATSAGHDWRDPSITALSSGRLLVGYDDHLTSGAVYATTKVIYSDNRGQTWSSAYSVPTTSLTYEAAQTSQMVELPSGTVLLPVFGKNLSTDKFYSVVLFSTDGGLTFGGQVTIASSGAIDYVEPQIRLLASGKLVCLMHAVSTNNVYRSVSTDDGATWAAVTTAISGSGGGGRVDWVEFFPGALFAMVRTDTAVGYNYWTVSWDEGVTWQTQQVVDSATDINMYAAPVVLTPGYIAVAYSIENSSTDADLYLRYYHDGYGIDPLGNGTLLSVPGSAISIAAVRDVGGHWEVIMDPATSSPPVPITTAGGDDWVYGWLSD